MTSNVLPVSTKDEDVPVPRKVWLPQPPPASETQFSPPTQKSAEPESMRILKSVPGVPILTVAMYPTSFALKSNRRSEFTRLLRGREAYSMSRPSVLFAVGVSAAVKPPSKAASISACGIPSLRKPSDWLRAEIIGHPYAVLLEAVASAPVAVSVLVAFTPVPVPVASVAPPALPLPLPPLSITTLSFSM